MNQNPRITSNMTVKDAVIALSEEAEDGEMNPGSVTAMMELIRDYDIVDP